MLLFAAVVSLLAFIVLLAISVVRVRPGDYLIIGEGKTRESLAPGWYLRSPWRLRSRQHVSTQGRTADLPSADFRCLDGETIRIGGKLFYQVLDPSKAASEIDQLEQTAINLVQASLTELVHDMERPTLCSRSEIDINQWLLGLINQYTPEWGVKVLRVDVKLGDGGR